MLINPHTCDEICQSLRLGMPLRMAAHLQQLTTGAVRAHMRADPEFASAVRLARAQCMQKRLKNLEEAKQWQAQTFLLESLWPEQFGRNRKLRPRPEAPVQDPTAEQRMARLTPEQRESYEQMTAILNADTTQTTPGHSLDRSRTPPQPVHSTSLACR